MKKYKTLIIFDWDDTLFPTSWVVENNIDLSDSDTQTKFMIFFSRLDILLYNLLSTCLKYGDVFIVTNAAIKWVQISSSVLPRIQKIINKHITVVSARDRYQKEYNDRIDIWKKLTFQDLISYNFDKRKHQHVISIGDAEHEFNALTDLYNTSSITKHRLLKTIRFIRMPSFDTLTDQLQVLDSCIIKVLTNHDHMDLKFKNKKNKL